MRQIYISSSHTSETLQNLFALNIYKRFSLSIANRAIIHPLATHFVSSFDLLMIFVVAEKTERRGQWLSDRWLVPCGGQAV